MLEAASLAGFASAHAVWCIADGEVLIPLYAYMKDDENVGMERMPGERLEDGVAAGQNMLEQNPYDTWAAVLIFDGRITLESGKFDALVIEFRSYSDNPGTVSVALPYTPHASNSVFAVHRPKIIELSAHLEEECESILEAFFAGVEQHEQGSAIWNERLDESL